MPGGVSEGGDEPGARTPPGGAALPRPCAPPTVRSRPAHRALTPRRAPPPRRTLTLVQTYECTHARTAGAEPAAARRRTRSARFSEAAGRRAVWGGCGGCGGRRAGVCRGAATGAEARAGRGAGGLRGFAGGRTGRPARECVLAAGALPAASGSEAACGEGRPGGRAPPSRRLRGGAAGRALDREPGRRGGTAPGVPGGGPSRLVSAAGSTALSAR